jgi:hypothetical protein
MMTDPATGETREVQLGSDRRLRTIFDANLRTARAAGQWERIERTKAVLPFLRYRLGASETHRPHHEDKAGTILPVDHPFWDEWMPPNGWGCKCWVEQIGRSMAERLGGVSPEPEVPNRVWRNARTGEDQIVPQGIDPGWQRNPGRLRLEGVEAVYAEKVDLLPEDAQIAAYRDTATSWRVDRILQGSPGKAIVGLLPDRLRAAAGLSDRKVYVNTATFEHFSEKSRADADFRRALMAMVSNLRLAGIASVEERDDGKKTLRILIPMTPDFLVTQGRRGKSKPTALVLWFDDDTRVRTVTPTTVESFRQQAEDRGDQVLDLSDGD